VQKEAVKIFSKRCKLHKCKKMENAGKKCEEEGEWRKAITDSSYACGNKLIK